MGWERSVYVDTSFLSFSRHKAPPVFLVPKARVRTAHRERSTQAHVSLILPHLFTPPPTAGPEDPLPEALVKCDLTLVESVCNDVSPSPRGGAGGAGIMHIYVD